MFKLTSRKASPKAVEPAKPKAEKKKAESKKAESKKAKGKKAKAERKSAEATADLPPVEPRAYRRPTADVYTVLLSIALIAVAIATTGLWMVMRDYDYKINGGPNPTMNLPAAPAGVGAARIMEV